MDNLYLPEGSLFSTPQNAEYLSSLASLERAMNEGRILESTVTLCDSQMRLHLELGGVHGIIEKQECIWKSIKKGRTLMRLSIPIHLTSQDFHSHPMK